ncbi:LysM peptidoglycan-binding domain-containing protein [Lacinutrix sp. MEBiC02404]
MRSLIFILTCFVSLVSFSQETETKEEFLPINLEGKEAFLSTQTGEYVFLEHAKTDATKLETTNNGVIYTDIKRHTVAKKETISKIAKQYDLSKDEVMRQNKLSNSKLSIGQELKIIKKVVVKSSSPVISQEEGTIIARLSPGQTPTGLDTARTNSAPFESPSPVAVVNEEIETQDITETETETETQNIEAVEEVAEEALEEVKETVAEVEERIEEYIEEEVKESATTNVDSVYIVKKGDNLYSIAKRHDIKLDALKKMNGLESNNLSIGQKLKLK